MMIGTDTRNKPEPKGLKTNAQKSKYYGNAILTVLKYSVKTETDFEDRYLPRLAGRNFSPTCKTPEEAYAAGLKLQRDMLRSLTKKAK